MIGGFQPLAFQPAYQQEAAATTVIGRRRKSRRLLTVTFDGEQVGVESAQELKHLASLSESIPKVALMPNVDYGSKIAALERAIFEIEAMRNREIERDDEEVFLLYL